MPNLGWEMWYACNPRKPPRILLGLVSGIVIGGWLRMISMLSTCQYNIFVHICAHIINVPLHYGKFDHTARVGVILFASQIQLRPISVSAFKKATLFGIHLGFDVMRMCRMCCAFHVLSLESYGKMWIHKRLENHHTKWCIKKRLISIQKQFPQNIYVTIQKMYLNRILLFQFFAWQIGFTAEHHNMCMSYEHFTASTWPTFEDSSFHP